MSATATPTPPKIRPKEMPDKTWRERERVVESSGGLNVRSYSDSPCPGSQIWCSFEKAKPPKNKDVDMQIVSKTLFFFGFNTV